MSEWVRGLLTLWLSTKVNMFDGDPVYHKKTVLRYAESAATDSDSVEFVSVSDRHFGGALTQFIFVCSLGY